MFLCAFAELNGCDSCLHGVSESAPEACVDAHLQSFLCVLMKLSLQLKGSHNIAFSEPSLRLSSLLTRG